MLNLAEELLLLTLVTDKPEPARVSGASGLTQQALRGTLVSELLVEGRLRIEGESLVVADPTPTGDALADRVLTEVSAASSPPRVRRFVGRLRGRDGLFDPVRRGLVNKEIVRMEKGRGQLGRLINVAKLATREEAERVCNALREAALGSGTPSPRVLALMGIARHCFLLPRLLNKEELRTALPRVRELTEDDPVRKAVFGARLRLDLLNTLPFVVCH